MPSLVRKIAIYATVNGLVLRPVDSRSQKIIGLQINYSTHEITPRAPVADSDAELSPSLEVHGIVGTRPFGAMYSALLNRPLKESWA